MRRFLQIMMFCAMALLIATAAEAQNRAVFLHENFDNATWPEGWTIMGEGVNQWSVSMSNMALGQPNEAVLNWNPRFDGISRLVSPAVDLTGVSNVTVSFKHCLDGFSYEPSIIGIATSSDGGETWNVGWSHSYGESTAYSVSQTIQTPDMGQPNVLFCVYFEGDTYEINNWYFDDIEAYKMENFDLGITAINLPSPVPFDALNIGFEVSNYGYTPITSVEAQYEIDGNAPVVETFSVNIPTMGREDLMFSVPAHVMPGTYDLKVKLRAVNGTSDDNYDNDEMTKNICVTIGSTERIVMIENFSSTTCGPCVVNNQNLKMICNNHPGRWTYSKFSTLGDPYCIQENLDHMDYYGVIGVPATFLDGEYQGEEPVEEPAFVSHLDDEAFMDIKGSFARNGNEISIKVDMMPYIDAEGIVFVTVNEKATHNNVGTNGETELYHVVMKMLPNQNGTAMSFATGEVQHLEFEQDMSDTNVEEMSDLEVAVWVQLDTKEILNSRLAYEYTDIHPYPVENLTLNDNGNVIQATWDAPSQGNPVGYNVFVNREMTLENTTQLAYSFTTEANEVYVVEVQAVYPNNMTSVKSVAGMKGYESVGEDIAATCKIFPNPASTQVRIEAEKDIRMVKVYDLLGNMMETIAVNGNALNVSLSRFTNGVYLFSIVKNDGTVSNHRVVVTH